jgi:ferredoxin
MTQLKIVIDKAACCGYGVCAEICPEGYKLDANGVVYVESELVPEDIKDKVVEGAEACPQAALSVVPA